MSKLSDFIATSINDIDKTKLVPLSLLDGIGNSIEVITSSQYKDPLIDTTIITFSTNGLMYGLPNAIGIEGKKVIIKPLSDIVKSIFISTTTVDAGDTFQKIDGIDKFGAGWEFTKQTILISDGANWWTISDASNLIIPKQLEGTNYIVVYGKGTPTENGLELQAAYDDAKKLPRYLGTLISQPGNYYKGQTFFHGGAEEYRRVLIDLINSTYPPNVEGYFEIITEAQAKALPHINVIVAPGTYNMESIPLQLSAESINLVSLTGNSDVVIDLMGVDINVNDIYVKGIYFAGAVNLSSIHDKLILENCESAGSIGPSSFQGLAINCIGSQDSFGADYGTLTGTLRGCTLRSGTFITPTGNGKIIDCIDGNNNLINYPAIGGVSFKYTKETLLAAIAAGVNVMGENLVGLILDNSNLDGADLTGINLIGGTLENASLIGTILIGAHLSPGVIMGAKLNGAILTGVIGLNSSIDVALLNTVKVSNVTNVTWTDGFPYTYNGTTWTQDVA